MDYPKVIALLFSLDRALIQPMPMNKRIKKRKSAPVLNEIFEENEAENENMHTNQVSDSALSYRHGSLSIAMRGHHNNRADIYSRNRSLSDVQRKYL